MIIPSIGFGTWKLNGEVCQKSVSSAISSGYRLIDTADTYANHDDIAVSLNNSSVKRSDIFLSTKVWHQKLTYNEIIESANRFLQELSTHYIDLLLIHWPNKDNPIEESIKAFEYLKKQKTIIDWGVSNFNIKHLNEIKKYGYKPFVNQIEMHPSFNQKELLDYCHQNNIKVMAYCPNGNGKDLILPEIINVSQKRNATPNQVILSWIMAKGAIPIPRSKNDQHIKENLKSTSLLLEESDIKLIDKIIQKDRSIDFAFSEF